MKESYRILSFPNAIETVPGKKVPWAAVFFHCARGHFADANAPMDLRVRGALLLAFSLRLRIPDVGDSGEIRFRCPINKAVAELPIRSRESKTDQEA